MLLELVTPIYAAETVAECWNRTSPEGVATITGIECVLQSIISPLPAIIALAAVFMIIRAGMRIISAGSDPKALASAWQTFTWAIIGIVLMLVAWLVLVIIKAFTGADVTNIQFL